MEDKIAQFKAHVTELAANPEFIHHKWFTKWHLEIVARIALELADKYPKADRDLVEVMAWLHDYGKTIDLDDQYAVTLTAGRDKLLELGFPADFTERAISYIEILDQKMTVDLHEAPLEVQIVSSADGCSHLVGPFMHVVWNTETDPSFTGKDLQGLMEANRAKATKDWERKIVLPEARTAFQAHHRIVMEQAGELPEKFL